MAFYGLLGGFLAVFLGAVEGAVVLVNICTWARVLGVRNDGRAIFSSNQKKQAIKQSKTSNQKMDNSVSSNQEIGFLFFFVKY